MANTKDSWSGYVTKKQRAIDKTIADVMKDKKLATNERAKRITQLSLAGIRNMGGDLARAVRLSDSKSEALARLSFKD